jgi:hypothetical protein
MRLIIKDTRAFTKALLELGVDDIEFSSGIRGEAEVRTVTSNEILITLPKEVAYFRSLCSPYDISDYYDT